MIMRFRGPPFFEVREDRIVAAWFHPGDLAGDEAFWCEGQPS